MKGQLLRGHEARLERLKAARNEARRRENIGEVSRLTALIRTVHEDILLAVGGVRRAAGRCRVVVV